MRLSIKASALLALLLALTVFGGSAASAQDEPTGELLPEDLPGLQHAVVRGYTLDYSAMYNAASPEAAPALPAGVFLVGATVLEFDSNENAESALTQLDEDTNAEEEATFGGESDVTSIDLDLGDNSVSYSGVEEIEGESAETVIALVQQETYVYFVVAAGTGENIQALTSEFTNGLIDNDGSGAGEFNEDGTSSGGLWDKFPAADAEITSGLIPFDQVLFPVPEGTPAA